MNLYGSDERPRCIMVPTDVMKRILPLLQSTIWSAVKSIVPGFIQGMNSK